MRIAIASGKGGTGKTTVATNLAFISAQSGRSTTYLDCDVEEPNGHLFLRPKFSICRPIGKNIPDVDLEKCIFCDRCEEICQFNAILGLSDEIRVYPELCHDCGGCRLVCPTGAISETLRETGKLEIGRAGRVQFVRGVLNVGESLSPPLVREVRSAVVETGLEIIDAPPGTSCPVVESIRGTDLVVLVAEPTPFGLNDLKLAVELVETMSLAFGVLINRVGIGDTGVSDYCHKHGIRMLGEIPVDLRIAETCSRGKLVCEDLPMYRPLFKHLLTEVDQWRINGQLECASC